MRVQWTREDELGWDPKGPPQLIAISGAVASDGRILDWRTELWIPKTTLWPAEHSFTGAGGRGP